MLQALNWKDSVVSYIRPRSGRRLKDLDYVVGYSPLIRNSKRQQIQVHFNLIGEWQIMLY